MFEPDDGGGIGWKEERIDIDEDEDAGNNGGGLVVRKNPHNLISVPQSEKNHWMVPRQKKKKIHCGLGNRKPVSQPK